MIVQAVEEDMGEGVLKDVFTDFTHKHEVFEKFNEMRARDLLVDLWLQVDGINIRAHRTVVAACSDYFMGMCDSKMIPEDGRVEVKDVDPAAFKELIEFMYTGTITITEENVEDLLRCSTMILLDKVQKRCCSFLQNLINEHNCLGIWRIGEELSCYDLANKALTFAQENFGDVCMNSDEFVLLPHEHVCALISSDTTAVPSEDSIYQAVSRWTLHDLRNRINFFPGLFRHVRLPFISEKVFSVDMAECELIKASAICMELVEEARNFRRSLWDPSNALTSSDTDMIPWLKPRQCMRELPVVVAVGGVMALFYNPETDAWLSFTPVTTRHCPGMGVLNNELYIVGGSREWKRLAGGVKYSPKEDLMEGLSKLNEHRSNLELVPFGDCLYAVGGYNGRTPLRSVERYDPKRNEWTFVSPMNNCRDGACVVTDGDYLYAVSGYDGHKYLSSIERYCPDKDKWEEESLTPIKEFRENASAVYFDGLIYVIGGKNDRRFLKECEIYDIENNTWSEMAPMSVARYQTGATVLNRWIFVCGGWHGGGQPSALVEAYRIDDAEWFKVQSLPTPCQVQCGTLVFPRKAIEKISSKQDEIKQKKPRKFSEDRDF